MCLFYSNNSTIGRPSRSRRASDTTASARNNPGDDCGRSTHPGTEYQVPAMCHTLTVGSRVKPVHPGHCNPSPAQLRSPLTFVATRGCVLLSSRAAAQCHAGAADLDTVTYRGQESRRGTSALTLRRPAADGIAGLIVGRDKLETRHAALRASLACERETHVSTVANNH